MVLSLEERPLQELAKEADLSALWSSIGKL